MKARYNKYNPKRKICNCSQADITFLENLFDQVRYGGNPQHKKTPGDFGLKPPCDPRPAKSLCDEAFVFQRSEALDLLKQGIRHGLVSEKKKKCFPQNIWSVKTLSDGTQIPLEAQLENTETGSYHGYPLQRTDPKYNEVLEKWRNTPCLIS